MKMAMVWAQGHLSEALQEDLEDRAESVAAMTEAGMRHPAGEATTRCATRKGTSRPVPPERCGSKLYKAMPLRSAHRMAVDVLPEKAILSENGWDALIGVIEDRYRAHPELDLDVVDHDAVFSGDCSRTETFGQIIRRVVSKTYSWKRRSGRYLPSVARRDFEKAGPPVGGTAGHGSHLELRRSQALRIDRPRASIRAASGRREERPDGRHNEGRLPYRREL